MQFIVHMKEIFSTIIALVCHVPFLIPTVFHSLPYLELPKVCTCITGITREIQHIYAYFLLNSWLPAAIGNLQARLLT